MTENTKKYIEYGVIGLGIIILLYFYFRTKPVQTAQTNTTNLAPINPLSPLTFQASGVPNFQAYEANGMNPFNLNYTQTCGFCPTNNKLDNYIWQ